MRDAYSPSLRMGNDLPPVLLTGFVPEHVFLLDKYILATFIVSATKLRKFNNL